jgi:hypothetical protein
MIRFMFRFLGLLGLAAAFVFVVYDGARSIANHTVDLTTVDRAWNETYSRSAQDVLKPLIAPLASWLWDPVTVTFLHAPIWVVLVVVASLFMVLGRKKRRLIGYARD